MKQKLITITITIILLIATIPALASSQQTQDILGDCGEQTCQQILTEVREAFPQQVTQLENECSGSQDLGLNVFQNEGQPQRVSFTCWQEAAADGSSSGQWLGILPLTANDPAFIEPQLCSENDQECQKLLSQLQSRYPGQIQEAKLQCAMKNGSVFLKVFEEVVDMRCGFFATSFWDENGDSLPENEDPVSVDISLGKFKCN
ncbi:MAG: hypothetical protein WA919_29315 [Coleofasciculaceae cyanobacterium]